MARQAVPPFREVATVTTNPDLLHKEGGDWNSCPCSFSQLHIYLEIMTNCSIITSEDFVYRIFQVNKHRIKDAGSVLCLEKSRNQHIPRHVHILTILLRRWIAPHDFHSCLRIF